MYSKFIVIITIAISSLALDLDNVPRRYTHRLLNPMTWQEASQQDRCMLPGMNLKGEVDLNGIWHKTTEKYIARAWIGAFVKYTPWFEFMGCFLGTLIEDSKGSNISSSAEPIIDCYKKCRGDLVLNGDLCYCDNETNLHNYSNPGCIAKPCTGNSNTMCGDGMTASNNFRCMCSFQVKEVNYSKDAGNCMISDEYSVLKNKNCYENHTYSCRGGSKGSAITAKIPLRWSAAVFQCFEMNCQFVNEIQNKTHWTGIFRKQTYLWGQPLDFNNEFHCLSVAIVNGKFQNLTETQCDLKLPSLCLVTTVTSDMSTSTAPDVSTSRITVSSMVRKSPMNISKSDSTDLPEQICNVLYMSLIGVTCFIVGCVAGLAVLIYNSCTKKKGQKADEQKNYSSLNMRTRNESQYEIPCRAESLYTEPVTHI